MSFAWGSVLANRIGDGCHLQAGYILLTRKARFWMVYEAAQTILQFAALALLFLYSCKYMPEARIKSRIYTYDAAGFAPTRYFLTSRSEDVTKSAAFSQYGLCASACVSSQPAAPPPPPLGATELPSVLEYYEYDESGKVFNVSVTVGAGDAQDSCRVCMAALQAAGFNASGPEVPLPGDAYRWLLPPQLTPGSNGKPAAEQQTVGLADAAHMMTDMQEAHDIYMFYTILRGVNILLFVLRLVSQVMFQPR